jgi:hypothetical protein
MKELWEYDSVWSVLSLGTSKTEKPARLIEPCLLIWACGIPCRMSINLPFTQSAHFAVDRYIVQKWQPALSDLRDAFRRAQPGSVRLAKSLGRLWFARRLSE